jgi:iron complex transport system permease protein
VLAVAPLVGPQPISWDAILSPSSENPGSMIFWEIRLPRACLAWICGVGLAAGGMVFQAMFRNPLAEPFTLGVSSGAALGATLCMRLGLSATFLGFSTTTLGGMAGAFAAVGLVYGLTRLEYGFSTQSMLLAGVAVNFFFASLILLIQYTANFYDTFHILRWMMGGFQMTGFDASLRLGLIILPVIALIAFLTRELDLLSFGEEWALSREWRWLASRKSFSLPSL